MLIWVNFDIHKLTASMDIPTRKVARHKAFLLSLLVITTLIILLRNRGSEDETSPHAEGFSEVRLAVIVPFRDRFDELLTFVPHLSAFLRRQKIRDFNIFIINQSRRYRFNRGALANVGYVLAKNLSDYIAIHDVDLLPMNNNLSYSYPKTGPYHLSSPEYHPQYNYDKYFGGILLISNTHFEMVNGMSNRYYGWGMEDDEFYTRVKAANLTITRPKNLTTGTNDTFLHLHYDRKRDKFKSKEQRETLRRRDRSTGLHNLRYSVSDEHNLTIDSQFHCLVFNVELLCDLKATPWCLPQKSYKQ